MRRALFLVLMMLLVIGSVQAVTVERIAALNCGFSDAGELACGETTVFSCEITDTTGASSINEVVYTIGDVDYEATRTSGTQLNGTWSATVTSTSDIDTIEGTTFLDYIEITNSAFDTCTSASIEVNTAGCFVNFTDTISFTSSCGCSFSVTETCQSNNVLLRQHAPGAGCTAGEVAFNTTGVCDFCDPGFQVESFTCEINRTESQSVYGNPFTGTAEVEFSSSNPSCCLTTGLDSDCSPPATDGSELVCTQGYWIGEYNDVTGSRMNAGTRVVADETASLTNTLSSLELIGGGTTRQLQPIVFDIDNDGVTEIVTFTNPSVGAGTITVYDQAQVVEQTINTGGTLIGDAGLFEFDARSGPTSAFFAGDGAGIALPVQYGTNNMLLYLYESGALTLQYNLSLSSHDSSSYGESQSVMCTRDNCYTVVGGDTMVQVDVDSGSIVKFQMGSAVGSGETGWRNQPVKVPGTTVDVYVAKGFGASTSDVNIYACDISDTTCVGYSTGLPPANVSELYVGAADGSEYAVYWTEMVGNTPKIRVQYLNPTTLAWSASGDTVSLSNTGSDAQCITAPAGAQCPAEGIGVASYWEPGSGSDLTSTPSAPWNYADTETRATILNDGIGTDEDDLSAATCSDDVCFQLRGVASGGAFSARNYSNAKIFVSTSGGIFTEASPNPELNDYETVGTCAVSDKNIAHGSIGGNLYVLRGEVQDYNSNTSEPFTCNFASLPRFDSFALDKYDSVTDTWSEIETYTEFFNWGVEGIHGREFNCNERRCWIYLAESNNPNIGDSYVVEFFDDDTEDIHHPDGTLGSLDLEIVDIIGFAETDDGKYYVVSDADVRDSVGTDTTALVKYRNSAPSTPVLIDINDKTLAYLGLESDPDESDTVYYSVIPSSKDADLCFSSTNTSTARPPIWDGANERIEFDINNQPAGACGDTSQYETTCNFLVRRSISESVNNVYSEEVIRHSSHNNICSQGVGNVKSMIVGPVYSHSIGDFDGNGDYYAQFKHTLCGPSVTFNGCLNSVGSVISGPSGEILFGGNLVVTAVISESEGVWHPQKVIVDDVNEYSTWPISNTAGNGWDGDEEFCNAFDMSETSGSGCRPWGSSINYRDLATGAFIGPDLYISNNYVVGPNYLQRFIRGVENGRVYMDILGESAVQAFYVQLGCFGGTKSTGLVRVAKSVVQANACPSQLITGDIDNDGTDEAMFSEGFYEFASGTELFSFNVDAQSAMAPVDFTSDTYMDFVFITGTSLRTITSEPNIQISFSDDLSVGALKCTVGTGGIVTATPTGVTAQNPGDLRFSGTLYGASGAVEDVGFAQSSSTLEFVPRSNGQKSIEVVVRDPISSEQEEVSCTVNVVGVPVEDTVAESELAESCSLDPDGEFNYVSSVQSYNWLLGVNGRQPITDGAVATFSSEDINMIHGLDCQDVAMSAEVDALMVASSNTKFFVGAQDDGLDESIGGLWLFRGDLYVATLGPGVSCTGAEIFGWTCLEQDLDDGSYHTYTMSFSRTDATYSVEIDGEVIGVADLMNGDFNGKYDAVTVRHLEGTTQVNYIRTEGLTGTADDIRGGMGSQLEQAGLNTLINCVGSSGERDFDVNPAGSFTSYANVQGFCIEEGIASPDDSGRTYCDIGLLQKAVEINPRCYQEAYSYCVNVTYPLSSGFEDTSREDFSASQRTGLAGAAACSLALQSQSSTDSLIEPLWNVSWQYARSNALMVMVLTFFVIVGIAIWAKAR